jgi:rare lipoprotein A (peptidoglycan hydrolase)
MNVLVYEQDYTRLRALKHLEALGENRAFALSRDKRRARNWLIALAFLCVVLCFSMLTIVQKAEATYGSLASWYALYGNYTASGDVLTYEDWSAAHWTLPMGTIITVCYTNGCARGIEVTDRGPHPSTGRTLDLNKIVADRIGLTAVGVDNVEWYVTCYACGDGYR